MKISFNDLVVENKDLDDELIKNLRKKIPVVNKFITSQYRQRRLIIKVDSESSESITQIYPDDKVKKTNFKITLGLKEGNVGILERKYFNVNSFNPITFIDYKLLHEICHCIYAELLLKNNHHLKSLISITKNQNQKDNKFLTFYGSFSATTNREDTEEEDIIELLTMYLWDIKYFMQYVKFLVNPVYEDQRKMFAIRTQNISTSNVITNLIQSICNSLMPTV